MQHYHVDIEPLREFNVYAMETAIGKSLEELARVQSVKFFNLDNEKSPHIHIILKENGPAITEKQINEILNQERENYFKVIDVSEIGKWES